MSWLSVLGSAAQWTFSGLKSSIDQSRVLKAREDAAEHNLKLAVMQAKITKAQKDGEWEVEAVKNSGWKDDAMFVIVMLPLIACFIPGYSQYVVDGFKALDASLPEWWRWMVLCTVGVSYGLKPLTKLKNLRKLK
ncbi:hypothetical protein [Luteibacter sp. ME-Dv--P-043b]|uniref:hypothetical protein n=1 Tax=Luteibacter sp. ME-Dv--P-043b TaxID=3040291 RepID=UPI0025554600|nr:hypothetical protein [Luteibacter sp. ME-Dv--P-043b]